VRTTSTADNGKSESRSAKVKCGYTRSDFYKPVASVFHVTLRLEHKLFLHKCFFDFVFVLSAMDGKIEQYVYQVLCEALQMPFVNP
jgi:ACT domain-containing protein